MSVEILHLVEETSFIMRYNVQKLFQSQFKTHFVSFMNYKTSGHQFWGKSPGRKTFIYKTFFINFKRSQLEKGNDARLRTLN